MCICSSVRLTTKSRPINSQSSGLDDSTQSSFLRFNSRSSGPISLHFHTQLSARLHLVNVLDGPHPCVRPNPDITAEWVL